MDFLYGDTVMRTYIFALISLLSLVCMLFGASESNITMNIMTAGSSVAFIISLLSVGYFYEFKK